MIETLDVRLEAPAHPALGSVRMDPPSASGHVLVLSGRVSGGSERPLSVRISERRRSLREVSLLPTDDPRQGEATFWSPVGILGLPPEFELSISATFQTRPPVPLAHVRARHGPIATGMEPRRRPLLVTALGRTGSTRFMELVGAHPAIVIHRRHPYEVRAGRYWMHMLKVLSEPADHAGSLHPDYFHVDLAHTGHHPYFGDAAAEMPALYGWFTGPYLERLAILCQEATDAYYENVASEQGQQESVYFAEKHGADPIAWLAWDLYPEAREVFLVRDPRDMFISMLAFNEQRGFPSFGRELVETDEEWVRRLRLDLKELVDSWRARSPRAHLVRYEDLVVTPERTLEGVFRYLSIDASTEAVSSVIGNASVSASPSHRHRTSETDTASIGRWRSDRRWRKKLDAAFADAVGELGYD